MKPGQRRNISRSWVGCKPQKGQRKVNSLEKRYKKRLDRDIRLGDLLEKAIIQVNAHGPVSREYSKIDVLVAVKNFMHDDPAGLERLAGEGHVEQDV
jgi:hypothetical protein